MKITVLAMLAAVPLVALTAAAQTSADAPAPPTQKDAKEAQKEPQKDAAQKPQEAAAKPQQAQKETLTRTLEVVGVDEKNIAVKSNDMIVDIKVDHDTMVNGEKTKTFRRIESRLDREIKPGEMITFEVYRDKNENHAVSIERAKAAAAEQKPGERARAAQTFPGEPMKLSAPVVGVDGRDLVVDADGLAVKIRADHDTLINGSVTKMDRGVESRLKKELQPGQQVQVEFEPYKMENRAVSIAK